MVCPYCSSKTSVTNSRLQKRNNQIWRRRNCLICGAVFTTTEHIDFYSALLVDSKTGQQPFLQDKLFTDILDSLRGSEKPYEAARELTALITRKLTRNGSNGLILTKNISAETAQVLKRFNKQAYLRYVAEHPSVQAN